MYVMSADLWLRRAGCGKLLADFAPDEASIMSLLLTLGARGNVRTRTLRAFLADEMRQIVRKMR
jgi:hypothetical protein